MEKNNLEKTESEYYKEMPIKITKVSIWDKIEKFFNNLNVKQWIFLLLAGWGWFCIIGELLNGTLLYALNDWKFNVFTILPSLLIIILIKDFMKTEKMFLNADLILKLAIIIGILLVALSFAYYFIIRPISRDSRLNDCLEKAGMNTRLREDCYKRY